MTESFWNKYDILRKSPEVPVKRSPKVMRKARELALNAPWDTMRLAEKYIIIIISYYGDH